MKIGILGTGIIASAVVTGFCNKGQEHQFFLSPRNVQKSAALAAKFTNVEVCLSNQEVLDKSEWIFISLLPEAYFSIIKDLSFKKEHKIVNMSAGCLLEDIKKITGETALLSHVTPLPFIRMGIGPIVAYPETPELFGLFSPVGDLIFAKTMKDAEVLQTITCIMSPYYALLNETSGFCINNGIEHDVAVKLVTSFFTACCAQAGSIENVNLEELAHEMTPGGYNEQSLTELTNNGAIAAWDTALGKILTRLRNS